MPELTSGGGDVEGDGGNGEAVVEKHGGGDVGGGDVGGGDVGGVGGGAGIRNQATMRTIYDWTELLNQAADTCVCLQPQGRALKHIAKTCHRAGVPRGDVRIERRRRTKHFFHHSYGAHVPRRMLR